MHREEIVLNTLSEEGLYKSLSSILLVDIDKIKKYIHKYANNIVENNFDMYGISKLNLDKLIKYDDCSRLKNISTIIVYHITPRYNKNNIFKEGLLTLPNVLLTDTSLSRYLTELGFEFLFKNNQIHVIRNGNDIDFEKLQPSNLKFRLGVLNNIKDFNVNGYLFEDEFKLDDCRGWLGSPEFLKSLSRAYDDKDIADNYAAKCQNYLVSFKVPVEQIDITGYDSNINKDKKTELLLKYSLNYLAFKKIKGYMPMYNPIIMLKNDYNVPKENICNIRTLKINKEQVVPFYK